MFLYKWTVNNNLYYSENHKEEEPEPKIVAVDLQAMV